MSLPLRQLHMGAATPVRITGHDTHAHTCMPNWTHDKNRRCRRYDPSDVTATCRSIIRAKHLLGNHISIHRVHLCDAALASWSIHSLWMRMTRSYETRHCEMTRQQFHTHFPRHACLVANMQRCSLWPSLPGTCGGVEGTGARGRFVHVPPLP